MSLSMAALRKKIEAGEIDTVLVVFPDHLGRLIGKRVTGSFFVKETAPKGMDACDYLLTVDVEMNPLPGFEMTSWDKGYGDFHAVVDPGTARLIPWLDSTALVMSDLEFEGQGPGHPPRPVRPAPRNILKEQIAAVNKAGLFPMMASELEFYLFLEEHDEIARRNFNSPRPSSEYIIDYHILHTTRDEFVIREIRNQMDRAGIEVEFSKGEWGRGQQEINLRYADALEMADRHVIYKNGVKEIAWAAGCTATFMAKYDATEAGSSFHLHTSVYDKTGKKNLFWDARRKKETKIFRQFLGGLLKYSAELSLFFAPTINSYKRYQEGTFAPTRIAWSHDNRTTGFRIIGRGASFRIENRMPGADGNPYLAYSAMLAAGLAGIKEKLDCGDPYVGDAYKDASLPRLPSGLEHAANALDASAFARKAFGKDVVEHYVHLARLEVEEWGKAVTDWERRRYFDRI